MTPQRRSRPLHPLLVPPNEVVDSLHLVHGSWSRVGGGSDVRVVSLRFKSIPTVEIFLLPSVPLDSYVWCKNGIYQSKNQRWNSSDKSVVSFEGAVSLPWVFYNPWGLPSTSNGGGRGLVGWFRTEGTVREVSSDPKKKESRMVLDSKWFRHNEDKSSSNIWVLTYVTDHVIFKPIYKQPIYLLTYLWSVV